jgi:hypothetical protein
MGRDGRGGPASARITTLAENPPAEKKNGPFTEANDPCF